MTRYFPDAKFSEGNRSLFRNIYKYYVAYRLTLDAQAEAEKARLQVAPAKN